MPKPPKKSKRFKYNLQSALNFRERRETQEQDKYNKAEQKFNEELSKEERMKLQEQQEHGGLVAQLGEGKTIDFQQVMMRKAHLEQLKGEIVEQEKVRIDAEEAKDTQREALVQAMKDKKILEEDKEKKRGMWREVMKKEEMKFLDEIAAIGFAKKMREDQDEADRRRRLDQASSTEGE
ncbi:MAG: flagellar export protein FliJ [Candidatus Marinamargulisbacteria bacterium]